MDSSALANSVAALRSSIKALESRSNSLEDWLYFWVALVVIGVVLEVGFVIWEYLDEREEHQRGWISSPHKPSGRKLFAELLGAGLVAIGVSGELAVDVKAGTVQTDLRAKNGELVQLLLSVSTTALGAASQNEKDAAQLRKDAEGLKKATEDERMARVKIEERVAWRRLTKEQQSEIASRLKRFTGQWGNIGRVSTDAEITSFATDIAQTLSAAGWHVLPPSAITGRETREPAFGNPIEPVITGVTISSTPDPIAREMAVALSGELQSLGYNAAVNPKREPAQGKFSIMWVLVEARPEGAQGELKVAAQRKSK